MLVKFFSRGKSGGDSPVNYLLGKDGNRDGATVLRGNAELTKELINATDYARRYTSGCLSFEEKADTIKKEVKEQLMTEFEKVIFAGLESDQFNVLWVEHTDKNGRLELNFLIPNQELRSGKRLQPYYHAADKRRVNNFQTVVNTVHKLSDPHDPSKKRDFNPYISRSSNITKDNLEGTEKERQHMKEKIEKHIIFQANNGYISNKDDVISALESIGCEITRNTKKSVSVKHSNSNKNIRLTSELFHDDLQGWKYNKSNSTRVKEDYDFNKSSRYKEAVADLNEGLQIKSEYHHKRFNVDKFGVEIKAPTPLDAELSARFETSKQLEVTEIAPKNATDSYSPSFRP